VQAAQVDAALSDWMTLLCFCDMDAGINTDGQSFVAGLQGDLSDLELTLGDEETTVPWRRPDSSLFSQTPGAEKLYVYVRLDSIAADTDTDVVAWRGCTSPVGEDDGTGVVSADTLAMYPMADGSDLTGVYDGIEHNMAYSAGRVGNAGSFNGHSSSVALDSMATASTLEVTSTTQRTFSVWLRGTGTREFAFGVSGNERRARLHIPYTADGKVRFFGRRNDRNTVWSLYTADACNDGAWHHVVGVVDAPGDEFSLYVDGVLEDTSAAVYPLTANFPLWADDNVTIGSRDEFANWWSGDIDEVEIIDEAWGQAEVSASYTAVHAPADWFVLDGPEAAGTTTRRKLWYPGLSGSGFGPW
jgi:hypothetical protein